MFGLGLGDLLGARAKAEETAAAAGGSGTFGRAKACILLFMWGGPAQQDTWDLKPQAPAEIRGEFKPIATNVPGIQICEHFPQLAQRTDKLAIVRSMTHGDVNHTTATHYLLTGQPPSDGDLRADWPHIGAVLSRLGRGRGPLPPFVSMRPKLENDVPRFVEESHGQSAGWLGQAFDPLTIDADPAGDDYRVGDFNLPTEISVARLDDRRALLADVNRQLRRPKSGGVARRDGSPLRAGLRYLALGQRRRRVRPGARARRDPRTLRPESARAIGAAGPAARRARRAAGDGLLAERRHQERQRLLGHAQPQLHRPERSPDAAGRSGVLGPARRPVRARHARRDAGRVDRRVRPHAARWASATATPAPDATAATTGPAASRACWPAAAFAAGRCTARRIATRPIRRRTPWHRSIWWRPLITCWACPSSKRCPMPRAGRWWSAPARRCGRCFRKQLHPSGRSYTFQPSGTMAPRCTHTMRSRMTACSVSAEVPSDDSMPRSLTIRTLRPMRQFLSMIAPSMSVPSPMPSGGMPAASRWRRSRRPIRSRRCPSRSSCGSSRSRRCGSAGRSRCSRSTAPSSIAQPSAIRLLRIVAPSSREGGRNRARV